MKAFGALLILAFSAHAMKVVTLPGKSPLVTFRIVFTTGAASDPQPGVASLTAQMLTSSGTKDLTYKQIVDAMFPMAAHISSYTDKEMTTFTAQTHVDNLEKFYPILRAMLLDPGWRPEDFKRIKDNQINYLKVSLRGNNDEELAKEELYALIYGDHPAAGTISGLEAATLDDLKRFYAKHFTQDNLVIGIAGGYPEGFVDRMKKDFAALETESAPAPEPHAPATIGANRLTIIEKDTRSVAYSIGFPLAVKRGDPDYPALLIMQSYFGQHRESSGRLYHRMREIRGLNYGDYAYIEYFPRGMFQFQPDPNLARHQQIFQMWIRPVEPPTAAFALRLAMFELDNLVKNGLTKEEFESTRSFLSKEVNLLTATKSAELGYAIDSQYYGMPNYNGYLKSALAKLTVDDVNKAIRKHIHADKVQIVAVAKDAPGLSAQLLGTEPTPMKYNSPKPDDILAEDKIVEKWPLGLRAEDVKIIPVTKVFE